jgi:hypothetical protein
VTEYDMLWGLWPPPLPNTKEGLMRRFYFEQAEYGPEGFDWCVYDRHAPLGVQVVAYTRDAEQAETVASAFEDTFGDRR